VWNGCEVINRYVERVSVVSSFRSVDEAASVAAELVAAHQRLAKVWRFAVVQLLDDYDSGLRHHGIGAAAAMWTDPPRATGNARVDAAPAAMAEYLARRDGWPVPQWAEDPQREAITCPAGSGKASVLLQRLTECRCGLASLFARHEAVLVAA
jgi:hypothetical protein